MAVAAAVAVVAVAAAVSRGQQEEETVGRPAEARWPPEPCGNVTNYGADEQFRF